MNFFHDFSKFVVARVLWSFWQEMKSVREMCLCEKKREKNRIFDSAAVITTASPLHGSQKKQKHGEKIPNSVHISISNKLFS